MLADILLALVLLLLVATGAVLLLRRPLAPMRAEERPPLEDRSSPS